MSAYIIRDEDFEKWKWPTDPKEFADLGRRIFGREILNVNEENFRWGICKRNAVTLGFDEDALRLATLGPYSPYVDQRQDYQDQAILCTMAAGRIFYMKRRGETFTKAELNAKALLLWAHMRCRSKGMGKLGDDDPKVQNELASVRGFAVNWPRVYKLIGLHGVKDAKRGRKPKPKL